MMTGITGNGRCGFDSCCGCGGTGGGGGCGCCGETVVDLAVVIVTDSDVVVAGIIIAGGCITDTVFILHVVYDVIFIPNSIIYCRNLMSD